MRAKSNRFLLLLASWFAVSVTTAQMRLNVFRGTLVHSRVRTEMEVLPDHVIGIDVNDLGRVRLHVVSNSTTNKFRFRQQWYCLILDQFK